MVRRRHHISITALRTSSEGSRRGIGRRWTGPVSASDGHRPGVQHRSGGATTVVPLHPVGREQPDRGVRRGTGSRCRSHQSGAPGNGQRAHQVRSRYRPPIPIGGTVDPEARRDVKGARGGVVDGRVGLGFVGVMVGSLGASKWGSWGCWVVGVAGTTGKRHHRREGPRRGHARSRPRVTEVFAVRRSGGRSFVAQPVAV
jgi:hypothetical protein